MQVDLIPQFLFNLLQEQSESSTSLEVLGGKEQVVKQFETEITAISSDPTLLELVATRTELLSDLEKLKLKLSMEKSRLASKKRAMIATGQEAKRLLHVINASRRECEIHRGNIQVADGLVFRSRHHLQHYEDQVALTKHQLLNEKDQELAGILKNTLAKRERRVAIAKCDLQRNIHQRASAHSDLRDAEQYLRDKEDNFKLWWSRAKRDETEWHVNSAGLVAVEKEAAFIRSQIFSVEQKSATKILDLIEKREALLNYKHQQVLRNLLLEKQHYVKLILSDQTEKELNS